MIDKSSKKAVRAINLVKKIPKALMPRIRSICINKTNNKILVGTFGSEIYELVAKGSEIKELVAKGKLINAHTEFTYKNRMLGHFTPNPMWTNEVWGLAALNKDNERYITCSDDATLRVYSNRQRKCLGILALDVD
jgi:microtubule-associated protein-like 6